MRYAHFSNRPQELQYLASNWAGSRWQAAEFGLQDNRPLSPYVGLLID
jgi:hypothetical protein